MSPNTPSPSEPVYTVPVTTASDNYEVRIGSGVIEQLGPSLKAMNLGAKVCIIADGTIAQTYGPIVNKSLQEAGFESRTAVVPGGETSKSMDQVTALLSFCAEHRLDRRSTVIALGGGVIGDLAGFVAASYMRGIAFVQVPTTLLAMVDSSVGGKTGVNLPEGKNLAGAFHQPKLVLADLDTLLTLPLRERAAGIAEIIKYGVIADESLFRQVERGCPADIAPIIQRSVEIKAEIVARDEKETSGARALLNFGHTLGHAIENVAGYGELIHGEAISIGMRAAAHLSAKKVHLNSESVQRIEAAITANQLPLVAPELDPHAIWEALRRDKKAASGKNTWVLSPKLGEALVSRDVEDTDVNALIELVQQPASSSAPSET